MYNLLVTADLSAWKNSYYDYDRSRFLEYTKEDITEAFESLDTIQIKSLKDYPCLFVYEGYEEDLYVGRLISIEKTGMKLRIEFKINEDIPPIPNEAIKKLAADLDIRDWEMNRTHWAIKDVDLFKNLLESKLISKKHVSDLKNQKMPQAKKSKNSTVRTVRGFIDKVFSSGEKPNLEVFYRGHSRKEKYKLAPSLFRKDSDGNYLYLKNEHIIYRELIISNSADFQSDQYTLDRLVRMQHYSLPTRLLDITSNPLIALYFACKSAPNEDGEVIVFSINRGKVEYFDSDVVSCISNLARLPDVDKGKINFKRQNFNDQLPVKQLVDFIKEEKPYFEQQISPDDLRKIVCVKSKQSNERISSQSGAFLLYGLDAVMDETGTNEISVSRITVLDKDSILEELDLLNINERTMFPYIENSAKYLADKHKFKKT